MNNNKLINWRAIAVIIFIALAYFMFKTYVKGGAKNANIIVDSLSFKRGCYNDSPCLKIDLNFPIIIEGMSKKYCNNVLGDYLGLLGIDKQCNNIDEFKTELLNYAYSIDSSYVQYIDEFKDGIIQSWHQKISMGIVNSTNKYKVIEYNYSDYMGGAHGSYYTHYQNINLDNYSLLNIFDVISDTTKLIQIAEKHFISTVESNGMKYPDDFWFEDGKFLLSEEFALFENGLLLHYNVYEVASYAQGDFEILIPYREIESILNEEYR